SAALALGAEAVVHAFQVEAKARGLDLEIVRNGSRGLFWLEPMVEAVTDKGRIAYGPVTAGDVKNLLEAGFLTGGTGHPHHLGRPEDMPYLKNQERLTFARCGIIDPLSITDYEAGDGFR